MRIDSHVHYTSCRCFPELEEYRRRADLDKVFLLSTTRPDDGLSFNGAVHDAIVRDGEHYVGLGAFEYASSLSLEDQVLKMRDMGFVGIKMLEGKPTFHKELGRSICDPCYRKALDRAAKEGMFMLVHIADPPVFWDREYGQYVDGYDSFESYIGQMEDFLSMYSGLKCIFAHLAFLARGVEDLGRIMESHGNLLLDTTPGRWFYRPITEQREAYSAFFRRFHDRILTGTDAAFADSSTSGLLAAKPIEESLDIVHTVDRFLFSEEPFHDTFPYRVPVESLTLRGLGLSDLEKEIGGDNAERLICKGCDRR
ncbi:MAG: amidohydrolase family protein [Spirochaetales bacterium]|nr:amidohydrolase family protein [Spirochaetales bacterium]